TTRPTRRSSKRRPRSWPASRPPRHLGGGFGVASAALPASAVAGKTVHYTGYIKTEGITRGYAGLWFRANDASGIVAFDNMQDRGATGTTDWKQYVIELPVDASATSVVFGMLMPGDGKAWFDDLAIEIDGQRYADTR